MRLLIVILMFCLPAITFAQGKIISTDTTVQIDSFYTQFHSSGPHIMSQESIFIPFKSYINYEIFNDNFSAVLLNGILDKGKYVLDYSNITDTMKSGIYHLRMSLDKMSEAYIVDNYYYKVSKIILIK